ncbi:MAG TPA: DUF402 domain-containing protein [Longimicrobiales bacterium]|nr:DUF402 domain-containing protein [Longimicrobiales bacterium]
MTTVAIDYLRPPGRRTVFHNELVHRDNDCIVTLLEHAVLTAPVTVRGRVVLENGAPAIWLTFPGAWHDIGLFHTRDGSFTGYYANLLTPVVFRSELAWETTDLFLDVWVGTDGTIELLDETELDAALAHRWITDELAERAHAEARRLLHAARAGNWPPAPVTGWTLERVRAALRAGTTGDSPG